MIRPPSLQRAYDDFYTRDPAFVQAPAEPAETATPDEVRAYADALVEYRAKIKAAKETGRWADVLIPGQVATKFVMGQIDRNVWRAVWDRAALSSDNPQYIGPGLLVALMLRLSIKSVVGFGDIKIDRRVDPQWGWEMAQPELIDELDAIDPRIVGEIGTGVWGRLQAINPLF